MKISEVMTMLKRLGMVIGLALMLLGFNAVPAWAAGTAVHWATTSAENATEFTKATQPGQVQFPRDLGAHPDFKSEWWYYTGNLQTDAGREFGLELTFFRQALQPQPIDVAGESNWRSNQIYSAHFAISDIADRQFYFQDRFSREAIALAGATSQPYRVWLQDWSATGAKDGTVRLQAALPEGAIDLTVQQPRPPVLQGDHGLSIKGNAIGNASYYYSIVQQPTQGTITVKGQTYNVTGITWKDHEYSTSSLDPGTIGWNWFSAQFDDGNALMLYVLRQADGQVSPRSAGTFITADGKTQLLQATDFVVTPLETWKSPNTKAAYPIHWNVTVPKLDLTFQVKALMPNQELNTATAKYWEGAVKYEGQQSDRPVNGRGYVELTGYADRLDTLLGG